MSRGLARNGRKKVQYGREKPQKAAKKKHAQIDLVSWTWHVWVEQLMYIALASMHVNNNHLLAFETSPACLCLAAVLFLTVGAPNV